ncbi:MAG: ATP-dependent helicase [bacterium]
MDLLRELNENQSKAVSHTDGPLLVLAGAGSGKTRVLAYRIGFLISQQRIPPHAILALTFTNKAAGEMIERVRGLIGDSVAGIWMGTFHSICARILRIEGRKSGILANFTIYDDHDQELLIKQILTDMGYSSRQLNPHAILSRISWAKSNLLTPIEFEKAVASSFDHKVAEIYGYYEQALRASNALDFDDLILVPVKLFRSSTQMLERYSKRFRQILIDEYQDTNRAQYELIKQLSSYHRNLCVVGDDDQSIYRWRGADITNILRFEHDFPDATVIRLEESYRSTKTILAAAQSVIANNARRKPKNLWTSNEIGTKIEVVLAMDEVEEGRFIAQAISEIASSEGCRFSDFVVLYRTNAQSRAIEDGLRKRSIPYVIVGGLRFYERKEVKDIIAYLRVIVNPLDSMSLLRIINVPNRGIGDVTITRLTEFANAQGVSIGEAIKRCDEIESLGHAAKRNLNSFLNLIEDLRRDSEKISVSELIRQAAERSGYMESLRSQKTVESISRIENIEELVASAYEFEARSDEPTLQRFLEEISLVMDIDLWDDKRDAVSLMTLHNAKGLEFPVVFIAGAEEGLLPHHTSLEDDEELEEERRLFYVGMTRAKKRVIILMATGRRGFQGWMAQSGSRFVSEIPGEYIEFKDLTFSYGKTIDHDGSQSGIIKIGTEVRHQDWGVGTVIGCEGFGEQLRLIVRFRSGITKRLLAKYANLEFLE